MIIISLVVVLFVSMLACLHLGEFFGARAIAKDPEVAGHTGTIDGAIFALFGLLVAFSFSGASGRFESRRQNIVVETNAIGTAYLRLDLLAAAAQEPLRELFRKYVDSRLEVYQKLPDMKAAYEALHRSSELQKEIWHLSVSAVHQPGALPSAPMLLLPALNQMIDITTTRTRETQTHTPWLIYVLLLGLALGCSALAGFSMAANKTRDWLHTFGFIAIIVISIYAIIDLEFPRWGFIRENSADQAIIELQKDLAPKN